jgi:hypothetical protein
MRETIPLGLIFAQICLELGKHLSSYDICHAHLMISSTTYLAISLLYFHCRKQTDKIRKEVQQGTSQLRGKFSMMTNLLSKLQITAILLMFTGWGWSGGNFTPSDAPFINPLLHCLPPVLLLCLSLPILRMNGVSQGRESNAKWAIVGISLFAVVGLAGATAMVILGASNSDPNAVGVKTLEDWFPTAMMYAGNLLWLGTTLFARLHQPVRRLATNS